MRPYLKIAYLVAINLATMSFVFGQTPTLDQSDLLKKRPNEYFSFSRDRESNKSFGSVRFIVYGNGWFIPERKDSMQATFSYSVNGDSDIAPDAVFLNLQSQSGEKTKLDGDHHLAIYIDSKLLISNALGADDIWTTGFTMKHFSFGKIAYKDFLYIATAQRVTFQIDKTDFDLPPNSMELLRDFSNKIGKTAPDTP